MIIYIFFIYLQQAPLAQPESPTASAGEDARTPLDSGESDKESVSSSSNGNGDSSTTGTSGTTGKTSGGSSSSSSSSSNSSAGTTGTIGKEKGKKDKDKDKDKKRADSVANKLGSFGKSLGSKLKKNVGGLMTGKNTSGSGCKQEGQEKKKGSLRGRKGSKDSSPFIQTGSEDSGKGSPSSTSERQNGSYSSEGDPFKYSSDVKVSLSILRSAMQGERKYIFAALLTTSNRQPFQEEMIQRYLVDAEERFHAEQEQRREAERKAAGGLATTAGSQLKKDGPELSYRSFESKEEVTDNSPPTFNALKSSSFSPVMYSGVVPIPRPTFIDHSPTPFTQHLHMHGYLDTRRQLAGGSPSSYPGLPSYATLPRHCTAQGPPHTQYHPPSSSLGSPSRIISPCLTSFPQDHDPVDYPNEPAGGYTNGLRDSRFTLDSRNGPMPVRHYSLGSAGGLANLQSSKCRTPTCNYYGHPETGNYCSYCYREELRRRETEPTIHRFWMDNLCPVSLLEDSLEPTVWATSYLVCVDLALRHKFGLSEPGYWDSAPTMNGHCGNRTAVVLHLLWLIGRSSLSSAQICLMWSSSFLSPCLLLVARM